MCYIRTVKFIKKYPKKKYLVEEDQVVELVPGLSLGPLLLLGLAAAAPLLLFRGLGGRLGVLLGILLGSHGFWKI